MPKEVKLGDLRARIAQAVKETSANMKAPTLEVTPGMAILFRVAEVQDSEFGPIVLSDDAPVEQSDGRFVTTPLRAYTLGNTDASRVLSVTKPGEKVRIPSFLICRAQPKDLVFRATLVYWAKYICDKPVAHGTFKVAAVMLLGNEFPEQTG